MRILPHHQDTGGFFVAVLEKVTRLPWERESCTNNVTATKEDSNKLSSEVEVKKDTGDNSKEGNNELSLEEEVMQDLQEGKRPLEDENKLREPRRKRKKFTGYKEDPFVFFQDDKEDVWLSIK